MGVPVTPLPLHTRAEPAGVGAVVTWQIHASLSKEEGVFRAEFCKESRDCHGAHIATVLLVSVGLGYLK